MHAILLKFNYYLIIPVITSKFFPRTKIILDKLSLDDYNKYVLFEPPV